MKKSTIILVVIAICIGLYIGYQKNQISENVATFEFVCEDCQTGLSAQLGSNAYSVIIGHREYLCQAVDRIWCSKCTTSTTKEEINGSEKNTITSTNYGGKLTKRYIFVNKELYPNTYICIDWVDEHGAEINTVMMVVTSHP
ncbi:MAG: hypothetical protein RSC92_03315, partial [Clostridia bacterium]